MSKKEPDGHFGYCDADGTEVQVCWKEDKLKEENESLMKSEVRHVKELKEENNELKEKNKFLLNSKNELWKEIEELTKKIETLEQDEEE